MELEELKSVWKNHYQVTAEKVAINKKLLMSSSVSRIKSHLMEFKTHAIIELVINSLFIFYLQGFITGHWLQWEFSLPAIVLWIMLAIDLSWNIYLLTQINSLNYGMSITSIQRKVNKLQLYRRYEIRSLYLAIPLFAVCFAIVLPKALFNFSIYPWLGVHWYYHLLGTLAITPIIVWMVKLFPDKGIIKARQFLEDIVKFETTDAIDQT